MGETFLAVTGENINGSSCNPSITPDWPLECFEGTNNIFTDCDGGCLEPPFSLE